MQIFFVFVLKTNMRNWLSLTSRIQSTTARHYGICRTCCFYKTARMGHYKQYCFVFPPEEDIRLWGTLCTNVSRMRQSFLQLQHKQKLCNIKEQNPLSIVCIYFFLFSSAFARVITYFFSDMSCGLRAQWHGKLVAWSLSCVIILYAVM